MKKYFGYFEAEMNFYIGIIAEFEMDKQEDYIVETIQNYQSGIGEINDNTLLDPLIIDKFYVYIDLVDREVFTNKKIEQNSPVYVENVVNSLKQAKDNFYIDVENISKQHKKVIFKQIFRV